jgi:hypothetical protein
MGEAYRFFKPGTAAAISTISDRSRASGLRRKKAGPRVTRAGLSDSNKEDAQGIEHMRYSADRHIEQARHTPIESVIQSRRIPLIKTGSEFVGPCPICGGKDRFSINVKKQVWNCRVCQTGGDVIKLIQHLDGIDFPAALEKLAGSRRAPPRESLQPVKREGRAPQRSEQSSTGNALRLWGEARNRSGTLAETYLTGRGIHLDEDFSHVIRFHPACPFGKERSPALVSLIRNIESDKPQGIQRTALNADGTAIKRNGKTFRMTLGPAKGGAIKVDEDAHVTQGLCVGEGVESVLTGRQMGYVPAWALLSDDGIASLPVLAGLEGLTIFLENDERNQNQQAANECGLRWRKAGRDAFILRPEIGNDLNDEIRETR